MSLLAVQDYPQTSPVPIEQRRWLPPGERARSGAALPPRFRAFTSDSAADGATNARTSGPFCHWARQSAVDSAYPPTPEFCLRSESHMWCLAPARSNGQGAK